MTDTDPTQDEPIEPAPSPVEAPVDTAELDAEIARLKDQLLRSLADQENLRRRAEREKEDARRFAASAFAKDLLSTADNLRRALDSMREDQVKDDPTRNLLTGVAATERELLGAFDKHGIRRVDPMGEKFDHNFHQAIFEVEHSGKPAGTVVQVLQAGFVLNDRLLRPAMVGVAKGPVKAGDGEAARPTDGAKPVDPRDGRPRIDTSA